jgi:Arc/MetJ-type ribon-helix-helix transcriptional regulator
MKVHISARVDSELAGFLEAYRERHGLRSRSEALERAIEALRDLSLETEYSQAMDEWADSPESVREAWDRTTADGVELDETW